MIIMSEIKKHATENQQQPNREKPKQDAEASQQKTRKTDNSNPNGPFETSEEKEKREAENLRRRLLLAHRSAQKSRQTWVELADSLAIVIKHLGGTPENGFAALARMGMLPRMDFMGAGDVNFGMASTNPKMHQPTPGSIAKPNEDDLALEREMNEEDNKDTSANESKDSDEITATKEFPKINPDGTKVTTPKGSSVKELHTRSEVIGDMKKEAEKAAGHPIDDGKDKK